MEHKPSYTLRMYPISKMRINIFKFVNYTSTKLESRTRIIKFVAEMVQGIG